MQLAVLRRLNETSHSSVDGFLALRQFSSDLGKPTMARRWRDPLWSAGTCYRCVGRFVIEPQYEEAHFFSEGLTPLRSGFPQMI
jgi:hypothetical protein